MNRLGILMLALVPLTYVCLSYSRHNIKVPAIEEKPVASPSPPGLHAAQNRASAAALEAAHERVEAALAKYAKAMTPQLRKDVMHSRVKSLEPQYRALFQRWGLDERLGDEVLKIVSQREFGMMEAFHKRAELGASGQPDYDETREIEAHLSELQLKTLLGEERAKELAQLEATILRTTMAKSMQALDD
jgi:hypothetical protein